MTKKDYIAASLLCFSMSVLASDEITIKIYKNTLEQNSSRYLEKIIRPPLIPLDPNVFTVGLLHGAISCFPILMLTAPKECNSLISSMIIKYDTFRHDYFKTSTLLLPSRRPTLNFSRAYEKLRTALAQDTPYITIEKYINKCNKAIQKDINQTEDICYLHNKMYRDCSYDVSRMLGLIIGGTFSISLIGYALIRSITTSSSQLVKPKCHEVCTTVCEPLNIESLD